MTTDEIMTWAQIYGSATLTYCKDSDAVNVQRVESAFASLRSAVDTLVAERDALRTERDALRQVIEQQLLNVPVGEWKK